MTNAGYPRSIREQVIEEFVATWEEYTSATAAASAIAEMYGLGKTTVYEWVRDQGLWPTARVARVRAQERELARLRAEIARLRQQGRQD